MRCRSARSSRSAPTATARWEAAQRRGHTAIADNDDAPLRAWAKSQAGGSGLGWREWLAGAQASVLAVHALSALAARARPIAKQAAALDAAYLSIGALTMLDSLVDRDCAGAAGRELDYARWYASPRQMGEGLVAAARLASERAAQAPDGAHHRMTLAGVVAYYASAPQARGAIARPVFAALRDELGPALTPALAIVRMWRLCKRARALAVAACERVARAGEATARPWRTTTVAAAVALVVAVAAQRSTDAARSLSARDEAHLRYVSASGATLYETGSANGTLPGAMRVHMRIGPTFSGSFTIDAAGGTISGRGSATPHGAGVYESFAGSLTVSGGTGRYRHASGTARLYGTFDRANYALLIQTKGTLHY